jgi:hypothetical protein
MQTAQFALRPFVLLAIAITGTAMAQPAPTKAKAEVPAMAALHAIDEYESTLEALLSHIREPNFEALKKRSDHEAKLHRAVVARDKVTDPSLHTNLDILLEEATDYWMESSSLLFNPKDTALSTAITNFHSDRALIETEITTGQRGLFRAAFLKRLDKKQGR